MRLPAILKINEKTSPGILLVGAFLSFSLLSLVVLLEIVGQKSNIDFTSIEWLHPLFSGIFLLCVFFYRKWKYEKISGDNFLNLLYPVFYRGLLLLFFSLLIWSYNHISGDVLFTDDHFIQNILHLLFFGLTSIFLISTFFTWKKLIGFQKTKQLSRFWEVFEYLLLASMLLDFWGLTYSDTTSIAVATVFGFMGIVLSFNLKWVAYLTIRQKWKCILLMISILGVSVFAIDEAFDYSASNVLVFNLENKIFLTSLFFFASFYALISSLVLLFNLPTTSVFEQKFGEVLNIKRLHQTIEYGDSESDIIDDILYLSIESSKADAGWIDIFGFKTSKADIRFQNLDLASIEISKNQIFGIQPSQSIEESYYTNIWLEKSKNANGYRAAVILPLRTSEELGQMILLTASHYGFENEKIDIVKTYAGQGSVRIQNFRLNTEKKDSELETHRIQNELKVAKEVQQYLLPSILPISNEFEVAVFAESAMEVGGDYYDFHEYPDGNTAFLIADVSGKGTSAAFNMAQMKGIFQSLTTLNIPSSDFIKITNLAFSYGMGKSVFITMFYLLVDKHQKKIIYNRAGHCPGLFYQAETNSVQVLNPPGMGIGIIRNETYNKYITTEESRYSGGDIILLYTDGIIESKNSLHEEFGIEKLSDFLLSNHDKSAEAIKQNLVNDVLIFSEKKGIFDDLSILVIKFL